VSFAVEGQSLFEVTFAAGLDKARYPELSEAGDAVLGDGGDQGERTPSRLLRGR
jgi:hypothetical protein